MSGGGHAVARAILAMDSALMNVEDAYTENAKVSDSGYANSCSNSQSHASSEILWNRIIKRKDKGCKKKKKSKDSSLTANNLEGSKGLFIDIDVCTSIPILNSHAALTTDICQPNLHQKSELVDATDPEVHNNKSAPGTEAEFASKPCPMDECNSQSEEYYVVISLYNGIVLHGSPSLYEDLGYPQDSWLGKIFIDFLNPKDKDIFAESIASEIAITRDFCPPVGANAQKSSIFCRLRRFQDRSFTATSNYQAYADSNHYVPYRINLVVQKFQDDKLSQGQMTLLVVFFHSMHSIYKVPEETIIPTVFTMRFNASCHVTYVDPDVVQYLGCLPQDMIGQSLFDFYHPEDMPLIKEIYENVVNLKNSTFRSRPYRFMVQNGSFVVLQTEWSSFINPWTKCLEFIVGHHRVLKGPADPNIFRTHNDQKNCHLINISEEVINKAKLIQEEMKMLLAEGVQRKPLFNIADYNLYDKKKELTSFVKNILLEIKSLAPLKDRMAVDDKSFSGLHKPMLQEYDSVMLRETSPHHEYFDSKSSTETPPSYNQLNYHDNIERFFNSIIGSTINNRPYVTDEENAHSSGHSSDDPGRNNNSRPEMKCASLTNGSGNSGSAENLSSESNNQQSFGSGCEASNTTSNNSATNGPFHFKSPLLTESLLSSHNVEMEKIMVQKHLEQKKADRRNKALLNNQKYEGEQPAVREEMGNNNNGIRLKRSGSRSKDGDNHFKILKYDDQKKNPTNVAHTPAKINNNFPTSTNNSSDMAKPNRIINAFPPTSTVMSPIAASTHQCFAASKTCSPAISQLPTFSQMIPIYYLPTCQSKENCPLATTEEEHSGSSNFCQSIQCCFLPVPYVRAAIPSLMYPPIIRAPTSAAMICRPFIVPETLSTESLDVIQQAMCPSSIVPSTTVATMTMKSMTATSSTDPKYFSGIKTSLQDKPGSITALSESSEKSYYKSKESRGSQTGNAIGMVRKEPPWIEGIQLTSELIYQYQINTKSLASVLESDLQFLTHSKQSNLVNNQLGQLFLDLELEGYRPKLIFDEAGTNSASDSSSDESQTPSRIGAW